jgi:hypothetical protein
LFSSIVVGLETIQVDLYLPVLQYYKKRCGPKGPQFDQSSVWHAECQYTRTSKDTPDILRLRRSDTPNINPKKAFRNPLAYAMELNDELVRDTLTRKQLAERHGITSDRVIQWLCLLKIPDEEKVRVLALGDNWEKRLLTERELRKLRREH